MGTGLSSTRTHSWSKRSSSRIAPPVRHEPRHRDQPCPHPTRAHRRFAPRVGAVAPAKARPAPSPHHRAPSNPLWPSPAQLVCWRGYCFRTACHSAAPHRPLLQDSRREAAAQGHKLRLGRHHIRAYRARAAFSVSVAVSLARALSPSLCLCLSRSLSLSHTHTRARTRAHMRQVACESKELNSEVYKHVSLLYSELSASANPPPPSVQRGCVHDRRAAFMIAPRLCARCARCGPAPSPGTSCTSRFGRVLAKRPAPRHLPEPQHHLTTHHVPFAPLPLPYTCVRLSCTPPRHRSPAPPRLRTRCVFTASCPPPLSFLPVAWAQAAQGGGPCADRVLTMRRVDRLLSVCRPCADRVSAACWPCAGRALTVRRPRAGPAGCTEWGPLTH